MEFKKEILGNVLTLNPPIKLSKGTKAKKVAMENLLEFQKNISGFTEAEYKGGSKFQNGDTLVARITPCLENGKTAYVDFLERDEIAYGSTEFFVLRPIEGVLNSQYLYYLMRTEKVRNIIIKSMTGTSGRQRAQKDSILNMVVNLPDIASQKKLVKVLVNIDEKIQLNKEIIANLEELSQTLFKRWFVDFEFPDENGNPYKSSGGEMVDSELGEIPKWWEVKELKDIVKQKKETFNPKKTDVLEVLHFSLPAFDNDQTPVLDNTSTIKSNKWIINENCCLFSKMNPKTPRIWLPQVNKTHLNIASSEFVVLESDNILKKSFIYNVCHSKDFNEYLVTHTTGSTNSRQRVKPQVAMEYLLPFNEKLTEKYGEKIASISEKIINIRKENENLTKLRDTLLPKLMSGEIEIPDDMEVDEDGL